MLSDIDLVARLTLTEDQFVERKPKNQQGEWLQATVAFANSTPIGYPAVLFIGVNDSGEIAENLKVQELAKSYSDLISTRTYPPVPNFPKVLVHGDRECIAVIIPGSENRPHFAGRAYVREGTQTKEASEDQFQRLIAERSGKVRKLLEWRGREIRRERPGTNPNFCRVLDCNQFFLTVDFGNMDSRNVQSFPLGPIEISFDHEADCLKIIIP